MAFQWLIPPFAPAASLSGHFLWKYPAGQWRVGANDCAIDHLQSVWDGIAVVQGLKDVFPQARKRPASKLPVNA